MAPPSCGDRLPATARGTVAGVSTADGPSTELVHPRATVPVARPRAVYVHVPFCPHVCPYCDFHKMRRDEGLVARYVDRLVDEIAWAGDRYGGPVDTIYFGGGTPSHLTDRELERITEALGRAFGFPARLETTLEADPATFDARRVQGWKDLGFDRLSIGVQSTSDETLRFLGRVHDGAEGLAAVDVALASGMRVSADLILAVPGQDARSDLASLLRTGVRHMSVYGLTIEPFTPFALRRVVVDEDRAADDFALAHELLGQAGLERYEISNHAEPGLEAVHNRTYWSGDAYLGLGPSAASLLPSDDGPFGERVTRPPIKAWLAGDPGARDVRTAHDVVVESILTELRTREGLDLARVERRTGIDVRSVLSTVVAEEIAAGRMIAPAPDRWAVTEAGAALLDAVQRNLFDAYPDEERDRASL